MTKPEPEAARVPGQEVQPRPGMAGGTAPCVLNAANEIAVHAFLAGKIGFLEIAAIVADTLDRFQIVPEERALREPPRLLFSLQRAIGPHAVRENRPGGADEPRVRCADPAGKRRARDQSPAAR